MHNGPQREGLSTWSADFRTLITAVNPTSHRITSLLALLSSSLANSQPLPPYLQAPEPYHIVKKLEAIDPDLLSVRHVQEPEFAAFAVMQVCSHSITADILRIERSARRPDPLSR